LIIEYFEYFCQISSKSIIIILSYTVSKFVRFFETQCRMHGRAQRDGRPVVGSKLRSCFRRFWTK